jgi:hypothetical protein
MVDAVVAVQWLERLQNTLEPYPGAYLALMISALLIAAGLANWVTKRILLRGLRRLLQPPAGRRVRARQPPDAGDLAPVQRGAQPGDRLGHPHHARPAAGPGQRHHRLPARRGRS